MSPKELAELWNGQILPQGYIKPSPYPPVPFLSITNDHFAPDTEPSTMKLHKDIALELKNRVMMQTQAIVPETTINNDKDKYGLTYHQRWQMHLLYTNNSYFYYGSAAAILLQNPTAVWSEVTEYFNKEISPANKFQTDQQSRVNLPTLCAVNLVRVVKSNMSTTAEGKTFLVMHGLKGFVLGVEGTVDAKFIHREDKFTPATEEQVIAMINSFTDAQVRTILRQPAFDEIRFNAMALKTGDDVLVSEAPIVVRANAKDLTNAYMNIADIPVEPLKDQPF